MKIFFLLAFSILFCFGTDFKDIKTFEAKFKQTIINTSGKSIEYEGKIHIKQPSLFFWRYDTPIEKLVYITKKHVTIIEPELEQAVISRLSEELNILKLIKQAKMVAKNSYEAELYNKKYILNIKDEKLHTIKYKDEIENDITLTFSNIKQNHDIDVKLFKYNIPYEYDIIRK